MEGHLSQGFMEGLDLRGSQNHSHNHAHNHGHTQLHHQTSIHENLPLTIATIHSCDRNLSSSIPDCNHKADSGDEEDDPSFAEDGAVGPTADLGTRGKKCPSSSSPWQRVKWSDQMVKLLITAVSYLGEDSVDCGAGSKRKFSALQKKGKWKSVSRAMAERGHRVSPQQCEDKFNDLNKRYKRLNDMLGRGTSCQVVENPALLDVIDFLTEKEKDDVRKILSSKHLFYEEMCSYHNGNRLHLPHDPALQRSLLLDHDHDDHEDLLLEEEEERERTVYVPSQTQLNVRECDNHNTNNNNNNRGSCSLNQWMESRSLHLEERKFQIQVETLELEKQRLRWERFSKKRDRELEKMRMENERMKLENERLALELKRKEMGAIGI